MPLSPLSLLKPIPLNPDFKSPGLHPRWLVLLTSLWIATICNAALWRAVAGLPELSGGQRITVGIALGLVITLASTALLSLLAWRWSLKPAVTLFLVSAAFGTYFMMAYGIVIDKSMLVNALQTDMRETRDLLNWRLAATVLGLAVLPSIFVWRQKVSRPTLAQQALSNSLSFIGACIVLVLVLLLFFQGIASVMRNHTQIRYLINPLNSFYALGSIAAKPFQRDESKLLPLGEDAKLGASYTAQTKAPLLLLVLGETGRSGNFALNGYSRPTTPELAKENNTMIIPSNLADISGMVSGLTKVIQEVKRG